MSAGNSMFQDGDHLLPTKQVYHQNYIEVKDKLSHDTR